MCDRDCDCPRRRNRSELRGSIRRTTRWDGLCPRAHECQEHERSRGTSGPECEASRIAPIRDAKRMSVIRRMRSDVLRSITTSWTVTIPGVRHPDFVGASVMNATVQIVIGG